MARLTHHHKQTQPHAELIGRQGELVEAFRGWVAATGAAAVADEAKEGKLIQALIDLKAGADAAVAAPFRGDAAFAKARSFWQACARPHALMCGGGAARGGLL